MSRLEMLTVAADFVESERYEESEVNGNRAAQSNGGKETDPRNHTRQNGNHDPSTKENSENPRTNDYIHDGKRYKDDKKVPGRNVERGSVLENNSIPSNQTQEYQQHLRYSERANGELLRGATESNQPRTSEDSHTAGKPPEHFQTNIQRRSTSPASERGGDTYSTTKPMVLLQPPIAATLSSAVSASHPASLNNPGIPVPTMHHPYLYPLLYQPAGAGLDPVLSGALSRAPGTVLKEADAHGSSPNGSPTDSLNAATAAGLHLPGLMYPLANHQALLMGARPPGTEISPLLLGQTSHPYSYEQYKRMLEGMSFPPAAYSAIAPQLTDQYLKLAAAQGLDVGKEALTLSALGGRLPPGLALAGPPGLNDVLLRYPEQWSAAMGMLRPQGGVSPRSGSPFTTKGRTDSPVISNGNKSVASSYPYHVSLAQSQLNNLTSGHALSRSPAAYLSQGPRSRSPPGDNMKSDVERSSYRSRSRDLDRDLKPTAKDLASASTANINGRGRNSSSEQVPPFSVTDENGRKIPVPAFYGASVHVPHGYHPTSVASHFASRDRSPSPRPRDDRSNYHRPSRDRSPVGGEVKRRSMENHFVPGVSPAMNERHNSRPTSPATNGLIQVPRPQVPLANGNAETSTATELPKHNPHLLPTAHARSPNAANYGGEVREQRNSTSPANPYLPTGVAPFFSPHLLAGHPGAQFMLPQYAQAIASAAKGNIDLPALYKAENSEYARLASLSLLQHQQQLLLAGGRPPHPQDYATLKNAGYFQNHPAAKESGKSSPANGREKMPGLPAQMHPSVLTGHPPQAHSPAKSGLKPKPTSSPQLGKSSAHHPRTTESHSPNGNTNPPPTEARRYHSPTMLERPSQEVSPKQQQQSSKPYRPNSMLRQHAPDLERSRKRKQMEEEKALRDEGAFVREKHVQARAEYLAKDDRKDAKRVKQLISENDPEEHFRRSLGNNYNKDNSNKIHISGSVDEHFKKALGAMYDQVHTSGKKDTRDTIPPSAHVLPSYSVAVASASHAGRLYSGHQDATKESIPRFYDPAYLPRDRYFMQSPHQNKKAEKSPPGMQSGPTVIYPQNPTMPRQKVVKAKAAYIPEADVSSVRPGRTNSVGSKGSTRSGNSIENIPATIAKGSPVSSPSENHQRPQPVISQGIPYTYAHQAPLVDANSTLPQRIRNSPTSSSRSMEPEESPNVHHPNSPRGYSAPPSATHRDSTESRKSEDGKSST